MIFPKQIKAIRYFLSLFAVGILLSTIANAQGGLSSSQARKAITRAPGFEFTNGAVRVKAITPLDANTAEVVADIRNVFKFEQDEKGQWRIAEIRTAPGRWESIALLAEAAAANTANDECNAPDPPFKGSAAIDPSVKRARCLVGKLTGIEIPSDAVRIQEVEPFVVPLASQASATVVAWVRVTARLVNAGKGWQVMEFRTGNRDWLKLQSLIDAVNEKKRARARQEMEAMAQALERYHRERRSYVVSDKHAVLIDHLSPRFLAKVIRIDPWNQPYKYLGQQDSFTLRSSGPDGKDQTFDDIQLSQSFTH